MPPTVVKEVQSLKRAISEHTKAVKGNHKDGIGGGDDESKNPNGTEGDGTVPAPLPDGSRRGCCGKLCGQRMNEEDVELPPVVERLLEVERILASFFKK